MFRALSRAAAPLGRRVDRSPRRSEPRVETSIDARIDWGNRHCPCKVVNVSPSGARLYLEGDVGALSLCFGQQLVVIPGTGQPIAGVLRWVDGQHLGIRFLTALGSEVLETMIAAPSRPLQHRPTRIQIGRRASIRTDGVDHEVSLVNISSGGALVRPEVELPVGTALFLTFAGLRPVGAHVRRRSELDTGLIFTRLLPVDAASYIARLCDVDARWVDEVTAHHTATAIVLR